jgi:hypothetical protein
MGTMTVLWLLDVSIGPVVARGERLSSIAPAEAGHYVLLASTLGVVLAGDPIDLEV